MKRTINLVLLTTLLAHAPVGILLWSEASEASEPGADNNSISHIEHRMQSGAKCLEISGDAPSARNLENIDNLVSTAFSSDQPIIRGLNSTLEHFHERHEAEFVEIQNKFGLRRFVDLNWRPRFVHSIRGQFDVWFLFQSPSSIQIRSADELLDGVPQFPRSKELLWSGFAACYGDEDDNSRLESSSPSVSSLLLDHVEGPLTMTEWHIDRFQLIGLVKHQQPVAYVSQGVPTMDRLKLTATESLNSFEQNAIDRLRSHPDESIVIDVTSSQVQMVGALRASVGCADCHKVPEGNLLGALTYHLISPTAKREGIQRDDHPSEITPDASE